MLQSQWNEYYGVMISKFDSMALETAVGLENTAYFNVGESYSIVLDFAELCSIQMEEKCGSLSNLG